MRKPISMSPKPAMQPLVIDEQGVVRFRRNKIVHDLLDFCTARGFGLNELVLGKYDDDDIEQFWQLIGYSVSGYGDLSFISKKTIAAADAASNKLRNTTRRSR